MGSRILINIKWLHRWLLLMIVYFVIYNFWFGWNAKPMSESEMFCDKLFVIAVWISIGWLIAVVIDFIKLVVRFISFFTDKFLDQ